MRALGINPGGGSHGVRHRTETLNAHPIIGPPTTPRQAPRLMLAVATDTPVYPFAHIG